MILGDIKPRVVDCYDLLTGEQREQIAEIMMEAHMNGTALIITCAFEPAEFYCETLKNHGLISTIEPDL